MEEIVFVFKCLYNQLPIGKTGEKYGVYVIDYNDVPNQKLAFDIIKERKNGNSHVCLVLNSYRVEPHGDKSLFDKVFKYLKENDQEWTTMTFFATQPSLV